MLSRLSVISVDLFTDLLGTLPLNYHLVVLNSSSRLPPINTNGILRSLVRSHLLPIIRLGRIFHRSVNDLVIAGTRHVIGNRGVIASQGSNSFFLVRQRAPTLTTGAVTRLCTRELPHTCSCSPLESVRILYPSGGNRTNAMGLGGVLRSLIGPPSSGGGRLGSNFHLFHRNSGMVRVGGGCSVR